MVELYVRSLAAGDDQSRLEEALSRLESLVEAERIDDYGIHAGVTACVSTRRSGRPK